MKAAVGEHTGDPPQCIECALDRGWARICPTAPGPGTACTPGAPSGRGATGQPHLASSLACQRSMLLHLSPPQATELNGRIPGGASDTRGGSGMSPQGRAPEPRPHPRPAHRPPARCAVRGEGPFSPPPPCCLPALLQLTWGRTNASSSEGRGTGRRHPSLEGVCVCVFCVCARGLC